METNNLFLRRLFMTTNTVEMLDEKISDLISESYKFDIESDEHQRVIEEIKILSDVSTKIDEIYLKENIHAEDMENSKKINWIQIGTDIAKVAIPSIIGVISYSIFQKRLLRFEETGTLASKASRDLSLPNGSIKF